MSTINGFHLFTVKEYSRVKEMDAGNYVYSDTFRVGGYDWEVVFDPHSEDTNATGFLGLQLVNDFETVKASFEFTLLDQSGKGNHDVIVSLDYDLYITTKKCCCGGSVTVQVSMLIFLLLIQRLMKVAFGDGFQDVAVQSSGASNERSI
ncbi:BTB/POZ and MATH domain-containing protein 3-like protein isoform X2 [Tanacetum coccineum]